MKFNIKKIIALMLVPFSLSFTSCEEHTHISTGTFDYDEVNHWEVCVCGEGFNEEPHTFDFDTSTCEKCGYKDPVYNVSLLGVFTGLTTYGKTLPSLSLPKEVVCIGKGSFEGSNAINIFVPKSVVVIEKGSIDVLDGVLITYEDTTSNWGETEDYYYNKVILGDYVCVVDNVPYKSLYEGINTIKTNDTVVTLVNNAEETKPIDIIYDIEFQTDYSLLPNYTVNATFNITANSGITFASNIVFSGKINLYTSVVTEGLVSGYVLFADQTECPKNATINVVVENKEYEAVGVVQQINKLLVVPKTYFAYGILAFSKDLKFITGLSKLGRMVTGLTIHQIAKDIKVEVIKHAFLEYLDIEIPLVFKITLGLYAWKQKGIFTSVKFGPGVTKLQKSAFSEEQDTKKLDKPTIMTLSKILTPLRSVDFGDGEMEIEADAFSRHYCLESIKCGSGIKTFPNSAFFDNYNLQTVDFRDATSLTTIGAHCFKQCENLGAVYLYNAGEWTFYEGRHYRPEDMTPSFVAELFSTRYIGSEAKRESDVASKAFIYYDPTKTDGQGRPEYVKYASNFAEAYNNVCDNGVIQQIKYLYGESATATHIIDKNITIDSSLFNDEKGMIKDVTFQVNPGKTLTFTKNVNFLGKVVLKTENDGFNRYRNSGGLLVGFDSNKQASVVIDNVRYDGIDQTPNALECKLNDILYKGFGLYNFTLSSNEETLNGLSASGSKMSMIHVGKIFQASTSLLIAKGIFAKNNVIKEVVADNETTTFGEDAFNESSVEKVVLSSGIKTISLECFKDCKKLKTVDLSKATELSNIDKSAFYGATELEEISFQNCPKLWSIEEKTFQGCSKLKKVTLPGSTGWFANGSPVDSKKLENPEETAKLLTGDLSGYCWTRSN